MKSTTSVPSTESLIELITTHQARLDLTDHDIATAIGFERGITMSLIKTGSIKFPLTKIPALAEVLEMDAAMLLVIAMRETSPDLMDLIDEVWGPRDLTPEEGRLVQVCRKLADGRKVGPIVFMSPVVALVAV